MGTIPVEHLTSKWSYMMSFAYGDRKVQASLPLYFFPEETLSSPVKLLVNLLGQVRPCWGSSSAIAQQWLVARWSREQQHRNGVCVGVYDLTLSGIARGRGYRVGCCTGSGSCQKKNVHRAVGSDLRPARLLPSTLNYWCLGLSAIIFGVIFPASLVAVNHSTHWVWGEVAPATL